MAIFVFCMGSMHAVGEAPSQLLTAITQLRRRPAPGSIIEHMFEQGKPSRSIGQIGDTSG
ncbi:hypothetical protein ACFQY4_40090 [Catellatospora bangladeshensis]|uniref:hypothetical protein n=1 Tax=Catellatospora bangladeshensis TaxID=310355 RepID=UPI003605DA22